MYTHSQLESDLRMVNGILTAAGIPRTYKFGRQTKADGKKHSWVTLADEHWCHKQTVAYGTPKHCKAAAHEHALCLLAVHVAGADPYLLPIIQEEN